MKEKNIGIRLFFSIFGVNALLIGILFITEDDLGNLIGAVVFFLIGLLILGLCWLGLITRGKINANTFFPGIFLLVGIILFASGIYSLGSRLYIVTFGEHVIGEIEGFSQRYGSELQRNNPLEGKLHNQDTGKAGDPYVSYEVDGKKYLSRLNQRSRDYRGGQTIEIAYLPDNPENICPCEFVVAGPCIVIFLGFVAICLWRIMFMKKKDCGDSY